MPIEIDIFLPELGLGFEYQGEQHYQAVSVFGGEKGFLATTARDNLKRQKFRENGFVIIEVPYWWGRSLDFVTDMLIAEKMDFFSPISGQEKERLEKFWKTNPMGYQYFKQERFRLLDGKGNLNPDWLSPAGYLAYHKDYGKNGNMKSTYINAMAVLTDEEKKLLQRCWTQFNGTPEDWELYKAVITIKDDSSQLNLKYYFKEGFELAIQDIIEQYRLQGISLTTSSEIIKFNIRALFPICAARALYLEIAHHSKDMDKYPAIKKNAFFHAKE